ncbi:MAG: protein-disulfide reductase DsbD family protein, partial [Gammaproteobacteria bacterium]|nr:protein-disulfide reductase DsbD family protein [Gammaproteobacteria bacterium]
MRILLASLLLLASSWCHAQTFSSIEGAPFSASGPEFLPVEEAYQLEVEVLEERGLRLYWQIADSYYLYQHRFAFVLRDASGPIELDIELPPALARSDEYFGDVQVYYHSADILLQTQGKPQTGILEVSSQGCADAGLCYPPQ